MIIGQLLYKGSMDILFKDITVVTMQSDKTVLEKTCVGISGKIISYIGDYNDGLKAKRVIDGNNKVLMPGLYNCHTHTPMSLFRGYANDLNLQEWLFNYIFPAEKKLKKIPNATYVGAMISMADMIASGTVAFSDMYFGMNSIADAVVESGMKACLSNPILLNDIDNYNFFDDKCYSEMSELLNRLEETKGRVIIDAAIHAEYTSNPAAWTQVIDFAMEKKINMQIHLSETEFEHRQCKEKYNMTPAQMFNKYNLFDIKTSAAHCVWIDEDDMNILAEHKVSIIHNPISNLKLASGIAPIMKYINRGINVALGTDGVSSNNSNDLFEEIKIASLLQKNLYNDTTCMNSHDTIKMATKNGAYAQGREENSGMIKEGFDADIIMLNFNTTRQTACYDYLTNIAYSVTGQDVLLNMCQGKILYENGEYYSIDIEKTLFEAKKIIEQFK